MRILNRLIIAALALALVAAGGAGHAAIEDTTPPTITITKPAAAYGTWYPGDVPITFSAKDNAGGSGLELVEYALSGAMNDSGPGPGTVTITATGRTRLTVTAIDNAANVAESSVEIGIDRGAPTITTTPAVGSSFARYSDVSLAYQCQDAETIVRTCTGDLASGGKLDTSTPGDRRVALAATDAVGNTRNLDFTYRVSNGPIVVTSPPRIVGTPKVGKKLDVDVAFSPAPESLHYTWKIDGAQAASGFDLSSYTPAANAVGKRITVDVRAARSDWDTTTASSQPTAPVAPGDPAKEFTAVGTPRIIGTTRPGNTLTALDVGSNPSADSTDLRWTRENGGPSVDGGTFPVTLSDVGQRVTVTATYRKDGYVTASRADSVVIGKPMFETAAAPKVLGTPMVDETLTATGLSSTPSADSVVVEWWRDGKPIAQGTTYRVTRADIGSALMARATYSKAGYEDLSLSGMSEVVRARPLTVVTAPKIAGTIRVGRVLVATPATFDPAATTVAYQWLRNGAPVSGATAASYKLTSSDLGKRMSVRVTGIRTDHEPTAASSTTTASIARALPSVSSRAYARGKKRVRLYVTVKTTGFTPSGTVTIKRGSKTVASKRKLRSGRVTIDLSKQKTGRTRYTVIYSGSSTVYGKTVFTSRLRVR